MNKKTLLRLALGLSLGLILVEGAAWVVDGGGFPVFNHFVPDTELGVRLDPGASTRLTFRGNTTKIQINDDGYRGQDWGPSQDGEILIVGDSQVFGLGVDDGQTHSAVLAWLSGRKVLNGGVITYGPSEYRAVVAEQLAARPGITEVVVVYNFANDAFELGNPNTQRHTVVDGWALRKELAPESVTDFPGRSYLMGRSHAVYHLRRLLHAGDAPSPSLPSEGDFAQLIQAQVEGEQQVQASQVQASARTDAFARQHEVLSESEDNLAMMLWEIEHPDQDPIAALEARLPPGSAYLDVLYPRNIESARPVPAIAALLLTSAQRLQGAEEKLAAWAETHPGAKAERIEWLLTTRAEARAKLKEVEPVFVSSAPPASPFWTELVALRALCAENGASLTVVGLPLDVQIDESEWDKYGAPRQDLSETLVLIDALMEDAERLGLRNLDLGASLLQAQPGAFLDGDLHMSPRGHAAVAVALNAELSIPAPLARPLPGLPEGTSRPPTWNEVRRLPESSVKGSSRNLCVTHEVREWLSVRCFVPPPPDMAPVGPGRLRTQESSTYGLRAATNTWTPQGLSLLNAPLETLTLVHPKQQISVVLPMTPGQDADVDFHWSDRTERLELRWEGDGPVVAFVDKRPSAPAQVAGGGTRWEEVEAFDHGRAPDCPSEQPCVPDADCPQTQVPSPRIGACLPLCDANTPCEQGTCLPWQGAQLCQ